MVDFEEFFYILDNNPLSDVSFANVFLLACCFLIPLTWPFPEHEFLILVNAIYQLFFHRLCHQCCI